MRRTVSGLLLTALLLGGAAPGSGEQDAELPPEEAPAPRPYVPPPAWKSVEVANFYLKRKKYRAALSRYQEAVNVDPYYAPGYLGLGKVYDKIGLRQKALENYRKYLDLLPSAKEAEEAKDTHEAISRLERELRKGVRARRPQMSRPEDASQTR